MATAAAAAEAPLLPIPSPIGTLFSSSTTISFLTPSCFAISRQTTQAPFSASDFGTSSPVTIAILTEGARAPVPLPSRRRTLSLGLSRASAKTSKPGPRLAEEAGASTRIWSKFACCRGWTVDYMCVFPELPDEFGPSCTRPRNTPCRRSGSRSLGLCRRRVRVWGTRPRGG